MIKKILKWTALVVLTPIAIILLLVPFRQKLKYEAPFPEIKASKDSAVIAYGKHLVFGPAHCMDCHSTANNDSLLSLGQEPSLTGGYKFSLPLGDIYSKNITPDEETGIGKYSDAAIARILRYGVHADGRAVYEFMSFHDASDEDLTAIISYLRSAPSVKKEVPQHDLNFMGNLVQAYMIKPNGPHGEIPKSVVKDTSASYGKYLAHNIANCNGCHTARDLAGNSIGEPFAGGTPIEERLGSFTPPNITPDSTSRIFNWSQENFIARFRLGKIVEGTPMPWSAFKGMTDNELKAIYKYLQTLQPVHTEIASTFKPKEAK
ncbi:cytochrome C [Chitinophaga sp. SYP-B3965]|uniref:c-type cytochrome n=1 Tax=Chitinophaga sp. SYP-B3965 TaxID=2663120 RepID=UPI001299D8CC|nr:cytochrome C [Chitinophaga sp. SYP-B3965]MRG45027.1 cytochrome C [Chitinophaga sp. SYP-B3965]